MNETNGEKNIVSKFLLGDAPNNAPIQATKLKIIIRIGSCKIINEFRSPNSSVSRISDSKEILSEFIAPPPNSRNEVVTIIGKKETNE